MADDSPGAARRALFRLEFGGAAGWGHLVRSGVLAAELNRRGWTCLLWTGSNPRSVPPELSAPFRRTIAWSEGDEPHVPESDLLVVDHYGTSDEHVRAWRGAFSGKILVLDDEGRRSLDAADFVVNPRLGLSRSLYPSGVHALLGERFALLRAGLRNPEVPEHAFQPGDLPVLVMMGGTDPAGMTSVALEALAAVQIPGMVPVIVRPGCDRPPQVEAAVLRHFAFHVWLAGVNAAELAGWAASCRMAISAAGGTLYELALLRLPFVSVVVAENQRAFACEVESRWGMPCVIAGAALRGDLVAAMRQILPRIVSNDAALVAGFACVDGRGAERVADALEA